MERDREAELGEAIKRRDAAIDKVQDANATLQRKKKAMAGLKPSDPQYTVKSAQVRARVCFRPSLHALRSPVALSPSSSGSRTHHHSLTSTHPLTTSLSRPAGFRSRDQGGAGTAAAQGRAREDDGRECLRTH